MTLVLRPRAVDFTAPPRLSRNRGCTPSLQQYRHRINQIKSAKCETCNTEDTITHVLYDCEKREFERRTLARYLARLASNL